ncbi:MAG: hypothetical protein NTU44_03245 [Bacteroidetes bacterium]|nr:hypothetical protein [Bacteroidota bacterium]
MVTRHWDPGNRTPENFVRSSVCQEIIEEITEKGQIIRVPHKAGFRDKLILKYGITRFVIPRKTISFLISFFRFFIPKLDNSYEIFRAADNYLKINKADLIIATGEPFILFKHCFILSEKYNVPYILDYRDGWNRGITNNFDNTGLRILKGILFSGLEKKFLKNSKAVLMASPSFFSGLQKLYHEANFHVVYNGFIEEELPGKMNDKDYPSEFTISYAGHLYPFQPLGKVLQLLNRLAEEDKNFKVRMKFIGSNIDNDFINKLVESSISEQISFEFIPRIPLNDYYKQLKKSHLLLLLANAGTEWLNVKLFDYLAINRMILMIFGDSGIMTKIILKKHTGYICRNESDFIHSVKELFNEFSKTGMVSCSAGPVAEYSRRNQTAEMAKFILKCVE